VLLLVLLLPCVAATQEVPEFRVESKQVLVPVYVGDIQGNEIGDLTANDFHLFEDGKEQKVRITIQQLDVEAFKYNGVSVANIYSYYSTKARWTGAGERFLSHVYLLSYAPPFSPQGSCHEIQVKASRRVWALFVALSEYCNTKHAAYDPFNGTPLDKKMEQNAASGKRGTIALSLAASFTYQGPNAARTDIVLEFPPAMRMETTDNKLDYGVEILGLVYRKDGSVVARFSDREDCIPVTGVDAHQLDVKLEATACQRRSPYRYEIQLDLPPGEYEVRAVVSNGKNFGVAKMPLAIEKFDGNQLAISGIALCKSFHSYAKLPPKSGSSREVIFPTSMVPLVSKGIEFIPTADERFGKTDPMVAYFEVYEPLLARQPAAKVQVHLRIVDAKASAVGNDFQSVDVASYVDSGNSTIRISRKIPTDNLPAGSYRLEVRAVDSDGVSTPWRSADFAVIEAKGRHQKTENGTSANLTPARASRAATLRRRPSFRP
jgi:hypothetical protein